MKLWFGKHSGEDLVDVPTPYLAWVTDQDFYSRGGKWRELHNAARFEVERRSGDRPGMGRTVRGFGKGDILPEKAGGPPERKQPAPGKRRGLLD